MCDDFAKGFIAGREAAAKVADYWGNGNWQFKSHGRARLDAFPLSLVRDAADRFGEPF